MPVDIAAICKHHQIVKLFAEDLNEKFEEILHRKTQLDKSDLSLAKTFEDVKSNPKTISIFPPLKGQSKIANDNSIEENDRHTIVLQQVESHSDYLEV